MANDRPMGEAALIALREQSQRFSEKATLLSDLLIQAEDFLAAMPGKIEVSTDAQHDEYQLSLDRVGKLWKLHIRHWGGEDKSLVEVVRAPISLKAEAAKRLPELFDRLVEHIYSKNERVDEALKSLATLSFLDFTVAGKDRRFETPAEEKERKSLDGFDPSTEGGFPDDEIPF
ncbi:hypothetical protein [Lacipirellula limnantheis]|uniref:Uncharacterized protein n=1 Tax=Lacipirellula limnantheis TaxID=2528024 RepID=A0A517U5W6_9BACT|nr:hypothetical protein [Lacipirellula limnantheis]QDT76014.1 hypothetical protein I41_52590 [Lacipirellula limnantheis]